MPINFPSNKNSGDFHEEAGRKWTWDGDKWNAEAYVSVSSTAEIRTVSADTTLLNTDKGKIIRFTGTGAQVLTIPDVLTPGSSVKVIQDNSGSVEFASSGSVNLLSPTGNFSISGQNGIVDIICLDTNEYRITGDVTAILPFAASGGNSVADINGYRIHTFTSSGTFEITSLPDPNIQIEYLVVAGGGGGGTSDQGNDCGGGGGGAGGMLTGTLASPSAASYTITVGAGGPGLAYGTYSRANGSNSSIDSLVVSYGGGQGGNRNGQNPNSGGSGAGACCNGTAGGAGTTGQGNAGGGGVGTPAGASYGGGGAGGVGGNDYGSGGGGSGGAGLSSSISGSSLYYAGGGGGGQGNGASAPGIGGSGVGGNGAVKNGGTPTAGMQNRGGGGGGGGGYSGPGGAAGGSGTVIIRYPI